MLISIRRLSVTLSAANGSRSLARGGPREVLNEVKDDRGGGALPALQHHDRL
jgi:hypothetical protein